MNCRMMWHLFMLLVLSLSIILHLLVECPCYDQYHFVFRLQAIPHSFLRADYHNMSSGLAVLSMYNLPCLFD